MPDILIRNVSAVQVARLDERAARLGLSRADYLRRLVSQAAGVAEADLTVADLVRAGELSEDLRAAPGPTP